MKWTRFAVEVVALPEVAGMDHKCKDPWHGKLSKGILRSCAPRLCYLGVCEHVSSIPGNFLKIMEDTEAPRPQRLRQPCLSLSMFVSTCVLDVLPFARGGTQEPPLQNSASAARTSRPSGNAGQLRWARKTRCKPAFRVCPLGRTRCQSHGKTAGRVQVWRWSRRPDNLDEVCHLSKLRARSQWFLTILLWSG